MRYHWDLFIKKISKLHHLLVVRYGVIKRAKIGIFFPSKGHLRKTNNTTISAEIVFGDRVNQYEYPHKVSTQSVELFSRYSRDNAQIFLDHEF